MELIKKLCRISLMELRKYSRVFQNDVIVLEPKLFLDIDRTPHLKSQINFDPSSLKPL